MKILKYTFYVSLLLMLTISCSSSDDNEDGIESSPNTVTFLEVTKDVIGGCTVQTFDDELGTLCTFTILYQLTDVQITVSATIPGFCDEEIDGIMQISDNFIGDNIRFGVSVIRFDGSDPDNYFGQSGTVTLVNNDSETSFSFDGVVYNINASTLTETIKGSAVCPI